LKMLLILLSRENASAEAKTEVEETGRLRVGRGTWRRHTEDTSLPRTVLKEWWVEGEGGIRYVLLEKNEG